MPRGPRPGVERGTYSRISSDTKQRLIDAVENGEDYLAAGRTLGMKPATARSIVLRYEDGSSLEDGRGGRREETVKLTSDVVDRIVALVDDQPDTTLKVIKEKLAAGPAGVNLSITSIARALDGKLITMKKLQDVPAERNTPRVKADRAAYAEWYLQNNRGRLIYIDETCFNLFTKRTRGRAERGQPAFRQLNFQRGKNLNLVMAVASGAGIVYYELQDHTMTSERFNYFLDNLQVVLNALDADNEHTTLVMDNAPVHRGAACGDTRPRFLPPYSPFLNPIENCFSVIKMKIRELLREKDVQNRISTVPVGMTAAHHRQKVLHSLCTSVLEDGVSITGDVVANMAEHVMRYMHRCSTRQDIIS